MPPRPFLSIGSRGFALSAVAGWETARGQAYSNALRLCFVGGGFIELEGPEAIAIRRRLERLSEELKVDAEPEPDRAAVDAAVEAAGIGNGWSDVDAHD